MSNVTLREKPDSEVRAMELAIGLAIGTVLGASTAWAGDAAHWVNVSEDEQLFFDAANWQDGTGAALATYPTNGEAIVFAGCPSGYAAQSVMLSTNAAKTIQYNQAGHSYTLGPITDALPADQTARRTIGFRATTGVLKDANWMNVALNNPDDFAGFWGPVSTGVQFTLLNDTMMRYLYATGGRIRAHVAAGQSATIGTVSAGAIIEKRGTGTLTLGDAGARGDTTLVLSGGTVAVQPGEEEIPAGSWLHLDAEANVNTYKGADGRDYVDSWWSKNGNIAYCNNFYGLYPKAGYTNAFLSAVTANGHRLIDFGARSDAKVAELGPKNCSLLVKCNHDENKKVREIFYAGYYTDYGLQNIVGNSGTIDFVHVSTLAAGYCPAKVRNGDVIYNGRKRPATFEPNGSGEPWTKMHVWSVGGLADMEVAILASDRGFDGSTGGCRIGEVIAYTNTLTHAQRLQVHRYLMRKWMGDRAVAQTADQAVMLADGALSVPAGKTAVLGAVNMQNATTLTKKGGGTLKLAAIEPKTAKINVQEGAVAFGATQTNLDTTKPAGTPTMWMDASVRSSFVISNNTAEVAKGATLTNFVTRWNDCRSGYKRYLKMPVAGSTYTKGGSSEPKGLPYIREAHANGLDTLSFGVNDTDKTWMIIDENVSTREGFVVVRQVAEKSNIPTLNTMGLEFLRLYCQNYKFLNTDYAAGRNCGGRWAKNGIVFDPIAAYAYKDTTAYHLLSFATPEPNSIVYLCKDRNLASGDGAASFGRQDIAEIILYNRELTAAERYQTEAYLMKKWLDKEHPLAPARTTEVGTLDFGDQDIVVDADEDLAVAAVSGGTGVLVKRGTGAATIASCDGVNDIRVEAGTLTTGFDSFEKEALFHFDASDPSTLTYAAEDGVTNVTEWADVRKNGVKATSQAVDGKVYKHLPVLKTETMRGDAKRGVVNFGDRSDKATDSSSGGMKMNTTFRNVWEAHTVYRNTNWRWFQNVFSALDACHYLAGYPGLFWTTYASANVYNGGIYVDGGLTNMDVEVGTAWHHIGFKQLGATTIDTIAIDRSSNAGGCAIGEMMAFSRNLTDAERDYLDRKWAYKWFGEGSDCRWSHALESLCLGDGATFANANDIDFDIAKLTACGAARLAMGVTVSSTLDMQDAAAGVLTVAGDLALAGGAKIKLDVLGSAGADHMAVAGTLSVGGALAIDLGQVTRKTLSVGEYVIASAAGGIAGFDESQVTVQLPAGVNRPVRVVQRGSDLVLKVTRSGFVYLVR